MFENLFKKSESKKEGEGKKTGKMEKFVKGTALGTLLLLFGGMAEQVGAEAKDIKPEALKPKAQAVSDYVEKTGIEGYFQSGGINNRVKVFVKEFEDQKNNEKISIQAMEKKLGMLIKRTVKDKDGVKNYSYFDDNTDGSIDRMIIEVGDTEKPKNRPVLKNDADIAIGAWFNSMSSLDMLKAQADMQSIADVVSNPAQIPLSGIIFDFNRKAEEVYTVNLYSGEHEKAPKEQVVKYLDGSQKMYKDLFDQITQLSSAEQSK